MMNNARKIYATVSIAEAITWTLLILAMISKYGFDVGDLPVRVAGSLHGFVFLLFVAATLITAVNNRWRLSVTALGLLSALLPWATLLFDAWAERKNLIARNWRFLAPGYEPNAWSEKLVAWIVRHPMRALLVILILVSAVFSVLLWLGPPTEWTNRF